MTNPTVVATPGRARQRLDRSYLERSRAYGYAQVIGNVGAFGVLLVLASGATRWWEWIVIFIAIGCAQHRLFFPLHDCIHYSLFPTRRENRFFGSMIASLLGTAFDSVRDQHLDHHRDFGKAEDPGASDYFVRFQSRRRLVTFLLGPLVGSILIKKLGDYLRRPAAGKGTMAKLRSYGTILLAQICVFAVLTRGMHWKEFWRYPLLYVLPLVTIFLSLIRLRMLLEHGSLDYSVCDYLERRRPTTRTIYGSWIERIVLCGSNFNYHHEHHLYPTVPGWQLPNLHGAHLSDFDAHDLRVTYLEALRELWRHLQP
jgi:fatty acid desaturase